MKKLQSHVVKREVQNTSIRSIIVWWNGPGFSTATIVKSISKPILLQSKLSNYYLLLKYIKREEHSLV